MVSAAQPVAKEDVESAVSFQSSAVEASSTVSTAVTAAWEPGNVVVKAALDGEGGREAAADATPEEAPAAETAEDEFAPTVGVTTGGSEAAKEGDLPAPYVLERTSPAVRAVLEGTASCEEGIYRFAGRWRLRWGDALTSEFEWRSVAALATDDRPCGGAYEGYFHILLPTGQARYEESELRLNFAENSDGGFNVEGDGKNEFGLFGIRGVVCPNSKFQLLKLASEPVFAGHIARPLQWTTEALELVRYASSTPQAKWFRKPVPGTVCVSRGQEEVVWYTDVIKTPMDFQTLRENVKAKQYSSFHEFVASARLIFTNAWKFNRPTDACYVDADSVCLRFERRLAQITGEAVPEFVVEVEARVQEAAKIKPRKRKAEELAKRSGSHRIGSPRTAAVRGKRGQNESPGKEGPGDLNKLHQAQAQVEELQKQLRELKSNTAKVSSGPGSVPNGAAGPARATGAPRRGAGRGPRRKEKAPGSGMEGGRGGGRKGGPGRAPAKATKVEQAVKVEQAPKVAKIEQDDPATDVAPLTENEKELLQRRIDLLDEERLEEVIDFLANDLNSAVREDPSDVEVQLDVEILPPQRQRDLVQFVEVQLRKAGLA